MQTIETIEQMDSLPKDTIITVSSIGSASEQWKKVDDDLWQNISREVGVALDSRKFRGAVSAGKVRRIEAHDPQIHGDPSRWQKGDWWFNTGNPEAYAYFVTEENNTAGNYNVLSLSASGISRGCILQSDIQNGTYSRWMVEEDMPSAFDWFKQGVVEPIRAQQPPVPEPLVEGLRKWLDDVEEQEAVAELMEILTTNGVDVSSTTTCEIGGTAVLSKETLSATLGGTGLSLTETEVDWESAFEIKVKRGCTCGEDWKTRVVNESDVTSRYPSGTDASSVEVTLTCPEHG